VSTRPPGPDGVAVVDKPAGWTSHDVVARARRLLGTRKVGHAGTLDPGATGVLLLGVGRATRLLRFLSELPKSYVGEVVLGVETSTLDDEGEVTATHDMAGTGLDDVRAAASAFVGEIDQVPPMVSAIKVGGRRLHELARAGEEVERAPRRVTVHSLTVEPVAGDPAAFRIEVTCSSGTYVRSLAADIGTALGGGAHLRRLRRTSVGPFAVSESVQLDDLAPDRLLPPVAALRGRPCVVLDDPGLVAAVGYGKVLHDGALGVGAGTGDRDEPDADGPWAVVGPDGALLAVYQRHGPGRVKPAVVLA
jgi:tRNA pseudouridine55 synthase